MEDLKISKVGLFTPIILELLNDQNFPYHNETQQFLKEVYYFIYQASTIYQVREL